MSIAADLYAESDKHISIAKILSDAGFQVTASERRLADGSQAPVFSAVRDSAKVSVTVMPVRKDPQYVYLSLLAKPRFSAALRSASEALEAHGALTSDQYAATQTI
jgi:hypothetical protein